MPGITSSQTDTYVCYNGGFEDGFDYYTGEWASWYYGSDDCIPYYTFFDLQNQPYDAPVQWTILNSLPEFRRFEIVSTGNDPFTGLPRVKKGSQSAKINNSLNHDPNDIDCNTNYDLNKLVKNFTVDVDNRIFTIWYSVVMDYPQDHAANSYPFFNIRCDLAPNSELCFDASDLHIFQVNSNSCKENASDSIKATNWVCHTIITPESEIGNIATLEIIAADCGCNYHFGYAYIDAICEPCDSSAFGGGKFFDINNGIGITKTCSGDTIELCGSYYLPNISGTFSLDSFVIPGVIAYNKTINTTSKTFCFKIEKSDFEDPLCKDIYALLYFSSGAGQLPSVVTKPHQFCYGDFTIPDLDIEVGACNRDNPSDNYFSDDYYYVDLEITDASYVPWVITRRLNNPIDGESGTFQVKEGVGNGTHLLGPFLIQEGNWALILEYNNCVDTFHIEPPEYCSGCSGLAGTKITNITCNNNNTWSYDIEVAYNNPQTGDYFKIGTTDYSFNSIHTISGLSFGTQCRQVPLEFFLNYLSQCTGIFNICPPQKCNTNCDVIESNIKDVECSDGGTTYYLNMAITNATCYKYKVFGSSYTTGTSITNPLGPFNADMDLMLFSCSSPTSCSCSTITCYKLIYVHMPDDCESRNFGESEERTRINGFNLIEVFPNPIGSDEIIINSKIENIIEYSIIDLNGQTQKKGKLKKGENSIRIEIPPGIYFLQYLDSFNKKQVLKLIKL